MTGLYIGLIGGVICGLVMVLGAMVLLYKSMITLSQASPQDALTIEFKKMIKITTQYPALGLFLIGLIFTFGTIHYAQRAPLTISGMIISGADPSSITVKIFAGPWRTEALTSGEITDIIYPNVDLLRVEIVSPGYDPPMITKTIASKDIKWGRVSLGEINFGTRKVEKPSVDPSKIVLPNDPLPSLSEAGKF
jgi:hypothetical protein